MMTPEKNNLIAFQKYHGFSTISPAFTSGCGYIENRVIRNRGWEQYASIDVIHAFKNPIPGSCQGLLAGCRAHFGKQVRLAHEHRRESHELLEVVCDISAIAMPHRKFRSAAACDHSGNPRSKRFENDQTERIGRRRKSQDIQILEH